MSSLTAIRQRLTTACQANNFERVPWLLHNFPDLLGATTVEEEEVDCHKNHTPLYHACAHGNAPMIELLLDRGAVANANELPFCEGDMTLAEAMAVACATSNLPRICWMVRLFPVQLYDAESEVVASSWSTPGQTSLFSTTS